MDGAVQSVVALMMQTDSLSADPPVPFALDALRIIAPCPDHAVVWLRRTSPHGFGHGNWTFDLDICDEAGVVSVSYTHLDVYKRQTSSCRRTSG